LSLHGHNEVERSARIVAALREGRSVALVTDAGTPAVSDPGAKLVRAVRDAGLAVVPVPGANAAIAAVSAAGLAAERFMFLGFLPAAAKARAEALGPFARLACALVIYEAPHRVRATVAALAEILGGERELTIARELTKKFETIARMPLGEGEAWLAADANRERGEFVLLIDAPKSAARNATAEPSDHALRWLAALAAELPPARAARIVAAMTGEPRDALYARALELRK
jgi:16S rRNA (cytidine1402-2'-O)-methyltransferase